MNTSYDHIPYMGRVHTQTHIERLALTAKLFHLSSPDITRCRVLELGCGDGSNLMNMAYNLPNSTFVGVDSSRVQINRGKETARTCDLQNVSLHAMNILDIDSTFGQFDYIICHGVFSWVPEDIRKHILSLCRNQLSKEGIAYISYNAYPGWKLHGMLRDMMKYHAAKIQGTENQIPQGRALVQFVSNHIRNQTTPYAKFIQSQVEFISSITDEYLYHEYLEEENQPFYFHEFVQLADEHQLQYLGDTDFNSMTNLRWAQETKDVLNSISPSIFELEQYMDMLRCRRFRCTLLVHHERSISREVGLEPFQDMHFAYKAFKKWEQKEDVDPDESLKKAFETTSISGEGEEALFVSEHSLYRTALTILHHLWPVAIHFEELCHKTSTVLGRSLSSSEQESLSQLFQSLFLQEQITLHLFRPTVANCLSNRPVVPPLARHMVSYQQIISTQLHDMVTVRDSWVQAMVQLLDGNHSIDEVASILLKRMNDGELPELSCANKDSDKASDDALPLQEKISHRIQTVLHSFLEQGVLEQ